MLLWTEEPKSALATAMGVASNHSVWREPIRNKRNQPRPSSDVGVEKTGKAERITPYSRNSLKGENLPSLRVQSVL
ncbi:hypothetical protein QQF64_024670 [Cirrhinus molitorella]|uniref:Uncharacterized protein n=1 Tax=Cirrhinus molitorella TaxID=172907 RepID=A0ABR3NLX1_9TELE